MAHILIVAATSEEIQPLLNTYSIIVTGNGPVETFINDRDKLTVLITGVGMVNTAFSMGRYTNSNFDAIINAGICGSFSSNLKLGDVVNVIEDEISELGAEDDLKFIKYAQLGFGDLNIYRNNWLLNSKTINSLLTVKGITVNTIHGNSETIEKTKALFNADVESMEGAAFYSGCRHLDNYTQVRAISNYVERRDKNKWQIGLAIANLNRAIEAIIQELFDAD